MLLSLINGTMDWTVNAAVIALVLLAEQEPRIHTEVSGVLSELSAYVARGYDTPYAEPLKWALYIHGQFPRERG